MDKNRKIRKVIKSKPTLEGVGVYLKRACAFRNHGLHGEGTDYTELIPTIRKKDIQPDLSGLSLAAR